MNNKIRIKNIECLSDNWYVLNKVTYEYQKKNGEWEIHQREAYDRGNGATILLYNKENRKIMILVAGPYRSETNDMPELIEKNVKAMNDDA